MAALASVIEEGKRLIFTPRFKLGDIEKPTDVTFVEIHFEIPALASSYEFL